MNNCGLSRCLHSDFVLQVEFSPPVDYVEPKPAEPPQDETPNQNGIVYDDPNSFTPFVGRGNRFDKNSIDPLNFVTNSLELTVNHARV